MNIMRMIILSILLIMSLLCTVVSHGEVVVMVAFSMVTVDIYDNTAFCILVIFTLIVLYLELIFTFCVPQ